MSRERKQFCGFEYANFPPFDFAHAPLDGSKSYFMDLLITVGVQLYHIEGLTVNMNSGLCANADDTTTISSLKSWRKANKNLL